ncbi:MAG: DUF2937 family protein [Alphaproteobacteria bacterium]
MRRWIFILSGLVGAVLLSQFPAFHQQYMQRLGGHIDELRLSVAALDERAENAGLDRYAYIRRLTGNTDPIVVTEGDALAAMVGRYVDLSASMERLSSLPAHYRAGALLLELDRKIGLATLRAFQPALPLTLNGVGHALAGFFIGYLGCMGLASLVTWRRVPVKPEGEL